MELDTVSPGNAGIAVSGIASRTWHSGHGTAERIPETATADVYVGTRESWIDNRDGREDGL